MSSIGNSCCQTDLMTQQNFPHTFIACGASIAGTSMDARIRPNLRLAFPVPSGDHGDDERFATVLDALAQRTGRARQIAGENILALTRTSGK